MSGPDARDLQVDSLHELRCSKPNRALAKTEVLHRTLTPRRRLPFGSAASGGMTKDSDIDLLVVEPAPANTHARSVAIRDAVGDIGYPVDVIVMRTESYERTKRVIGGIAYPANKYGRVIYAAA